MPAARDQLLSHLQSSPAETRTYHPWVLTAAKRLGRSADEIASIVPFFIRRCPFAEVSATTSLTIEELNWLFKQSWQVGARTETSADAAPPRTVRERARDHLRYTYLFANVPRLLAEGFDAPAVCSQLKMTRAELKVIQQDLTGVTVPLTAAPHEHMWRKRLNHRGRDRDQSLGPEAAYRAGLRRRFADAALLWKRGWTIQRCCRRLVIHESNLIYFISELRRLGDGALFPPRGILASHQDQAALSRMVVTWSARRPWTQSLNGRLIVPSKLSARS